jgi:hypothetical protein
MKKYYFLFICLLTSSVSFSFGQEFEKSVLIDMPEDNYDYDILSLSYSVKNDSYITWINNNGSFYSVYLKQISPVTGENILIDTSNYPLSGVCIAANDTSVFLAWQKKLPDYYRVILYNNKLDAPGKVVILDSILNDPQISINNSYIAWIQDSRLYTTKITGNNGFVYLVDSAGCSKPEIKKIN